MQRGSVFSYFLLIFFSTFLHFYDSLRFSFSSYSQRLCFHHDSHIPTAEEPSMGCAAASCPLPPSQGAPAAVLGGCLLWSLPALLSHAGHEAAVCLLPSKARNTSEAAGMCPGLLFPAPSPLLSPRCETRAERAARAVRGVSYDPISPVYDLMIQVCGVGSSSAAGLVLTSSCRMVLVPPERQKPGCGEQGKVTCQVSCSRDLSQTSPDTVPVLYAVSAAGSTHH